MKRLERVGERLLARLVPSLSACACTCYVQVDPYQCRMRTCCKCASGTVCDAWRPAC